MSGAAANISTGGDVVADRDRLLVLRAEHELTSLATLIAHLEISDLAKNRAARGLEVIGAALASRRSELGLAPRWAAA